MRTSKRVPRDLLFVGLAFAAAWAAPVVANAQNFNQAIVFGDSNVDSGYYRALPNPGGGAGINAAWAAAVAAGAGIPTSSPGLMNSEVLASYFGLTAHPANQPGGTNYATSGAKNLVTNDGTNGGFQQAIPTVTQFANYLASVGGAANPNALYLINSGSNDVSFALGNGSATSPPADPTGYVVNSAQGLALGVAQLQSAGAKTIVVTGLPFSFPGGAGNAFARELRYTYTQTLWWSLAGQGVNFIPADLNAVRVAIRDNRSAFGFEFITTNPGETACVDPGGVGNAFALLCSSAPGAPSQLANPTADQTRLFADEEGHLSTAGQKIMADYIYSLIVAPAQISMLAENAVKTRTSVVSGIQNQIQATFAQSGPGAFNAWVVGDVSRLEIESYNGFPDDPSNPVALTGGISARIAPGVIIGAAVGISHNSPKYGLGRGEFKQDEVSGSVYGAAQVGPVWGTLIGSYGSLKYDVNRLVPIGRTIQSNFGNTDGENWSAAAQAGYDFKLGILKHGPVAGIVWQRIGVDGFVESGTFGAFTALGFGDQTRNSAVSSLGWRAKLDLGMFQPFAQVVWNRELASTDREITAYLTSVYAPSWHQPAVLVGKDWGTASVGTFVRIGPGMLAQMSVQTEFGDHGVKTYGGQLGLNIQF